MSDQEEEEDEDYVEESEAATSDEEGSDDDVEDDSGDDESPPVRSKSESDRSGKSGEEKEDAKKAGMKRKAEKVKDVKMKKVKKTAAASALKSTDKGKKIIKKSSEPEIQAEPVKAITKKDSKKDSKKTDAHANAVAGEKNYPVFEEKNIDYNFVKNSSLNVVQRRCQIAPNIILQCKNVEFTQNGQQIDFASLTFSRKTKNGRAFDYNMPLSLAPVLIEAVQQIINDNVKFFASIQKEREKN